MKREILGTQLLFALRELQLQLVLVAHQFVERGGAGNVPDAEFDVDGEEEEEHWIARESRRGHHS